MPSTEPVACGNRFLQKRRQRVELALADVPIEIGEDVLDEDLAAELFAEEADVAADDRPEVEQHRRLARRQRVRNLRSALVAKTGSSTAADGRRGRVGVGSARREAIEQAHDETVRVRSSRMRAHSRLLTLTSRVCGADALRRRGCGCGGAAAARGLAPPAWPAAWLPPLRCMSTLPRKCAPSAIATRGEMMSPSTDPLSRMSTFSLAVTLPVTSPSTITALANTCALMRAVRADRQHVVAQLNRAFDVAFDRQVLAAVQLALDDDRFADVHDVLLHVMARLRTRTGQPRPCGRRGWLRRSRWLSARRADGFIAFPHVILRLTSCFEAQGAQGAASRIGARRSRSQYMERVQILSSPFVTEG